MKHSKTMQSLTLYAILIVVLLGAYGFFFWHIQNKESTTAELVAEAAQLQKQSTQVSNLNATIRNIENKKDTLASLFVTSGSIVDFLETIEEIGTLSDVSVKVGSISEEDTRNDAINKLNLELAVEGRWSDVYYFFTLLENIPLKITVHRVGIGKRESESGPTVWRGSAQISVLQLK